MPALLIELVRYTTEKSLGEAIMRVALVMLLWASGLLFGNSEVLERAHKLYRHTDYEAAIQLLSQVDDNSPAVNELLGQCYFMTGDYRKSTDYLEKAAAAEPNNSIYHTWLGRVYGRRAETSFALNAVGWASKSRTSLEKATRLDPANWEAVDDLFEFYLQAPGFMGGGLERAEKLADVVARRDPAEAAYDRARIAEARKQYGPAEQYLKRAAELAPHQVGRLLDLAKFLAKQGRYEESDRTFVQAEQVAPDAPKVLFAKASTYIKTNRNVDTARDLLKKYLSASNLTPEDPPKSEAERLLRKASGS
jgi:tetratricopeptide (TPR) repeat protein